MRLRRFPLVLTISAVLLHACADLPTALLAPGGNDLVSSRAAPQVGTARFEIDFMQDMIDHHAMAVETAELCVAKAVHEELRELCQRIIAAQSREIEVLQRWLRQWYGVSYEPQMKPADERMIEDLASLSGAEFEIAFMQMMIEHHEAAIREADTCLDRAYHRELERLCGNIVATQSAEIEQMRSWMCEWYRICK